MTKVALFFLALLLFSGGFMAIRYSLPEPEEETSSELLAEFSFIDQFGKPFTNDDLKGQVWIGSFFFSQCPSTCHEQNLRVAELQRDFCERGLEIVSITCDPANDTPSVMNLYSKRYGANPEYWHFLMGDFDYTRRVAAEFFRIAVHEQTHSDRIVVFDTDGKLLNSFRTRDPKDFLKAQELLDELLPKSTTLSTPETASEVDATS